ncbi:MULTISPECIES: tyrosinase family protein [unclassified Pseudomonas]|uniref:tyrosinase family protein n=2 Tax=unclassified Pseudomonas TaxID=196821 RepID=UPI0021146BCF|nr:MULTISPECIES: tyrosinase family protein [unclassified Pseudomonas]
MPDTFAILFPTGAGERVELNEASSMRKLECANIQWSFRNMDIRINHRDMTPDQKSRFVRAVLTLKNDVDSVLRPGQQSRYDDFVQIHKNSMGRGNPLVPNPHATPLFYPWHRVLLRQFELALQSAVDDPDITLPYWNWQLTGADNPFTSDFMGANGDNLDRQHLISGPFTLEANRFRVAVWDTDIAPTPDNISLRRNFGQAGRLPGPDEVIDVLNRPSYQQDANGWELVSQRQLHNPVHGWIGGNMAEASSPNDPIFFLHHCYMDLLWERWKQQHRSSGKPFAEPLLNQTLVFHPDNEPAPWPQTFTVQETIDTQALNYRYASV